MKPTDHRVLFNGDCNFLFARDYRPSGQCHGPYTAEVLDDYVDLLADSGVDTFVINASGQVPWYPSRNLPHVLTGYTQGDREFVRPHFPALDETFSQEQLDRCLDSHVAILDRLLDLAERGVDWIARLAARCRERGISPWVSVRMNDGHGANNWSGSYFNCPQQKEPRYRLSGKRLDPRRGIDRCIQLTSYDHAEVRDFYLRLVRELIEDYDFDGIELDWMREPLCCEPPASQETIDIITAWHGQIRRLARQRTTKHPKPFFVGMRIPGRLGVLRTVGIDVAEMARQDLIDFVGPTNTWQTTWDVPYDRMRAELGDDVALYGVIEDAPNWMFCRSADGDRQSYRLLSSSAELMRGNAAGKLATGADGIEFFNFFCTDNEGTFGTDHPGAARYDAIRGIADLDGLRGLRGLPKHYCLSTSRNYWSPRFFERAEQLPAYVEPGCWRAFELGACSEPAGCGRALFVQVVIDRAHSGPSDCPPPELGVSLNGSWPTFEGTVTDQLILPTGIYTHHVTEYEAWEYGIDLSLLRDGLNEILLIHSDDTCDPSPAFGGNPIRIVGLELAVR